MDNPKDLSNQTGKWLRRSLEIAESVSGEVNSELQALYDYWRLPSFRLAFVGELSTGKSSLINLLLGRNLLPVSLLPTTATLTSIINGSRESMEVSFANGNRETRSLEKSSWDDLLATNEQGEVQEVSAEVVQLTLSHPWLESIDIELIDTPPVGDINEQRSALLSKLLGQCDATVLIVSKNSPLSMTEKAFLQEEIMGRNIPRILVVVSKLDLLSQEERLNIFNNISERVRRISPEITVLPLHSVNADTTEETALGKVRTKIEEILAKEGRRAWRSQRVAAQIINYLEQLVEISQTNITAISMSAAKREEALQQLQANINQANLKWNGIELELNQHRLEHDQKLRQYLNQEKSNLLESCRVEMKKQKQQADLKFWWEESFPIDLRSGLVDLDRKLDDLVLQKLTSDIQRLQAEVEQVFDIKLGTRNIELLEQTEITPEALDSQFQLTDNKYRLIWENIGGAAPSVLGGISGLLAGPILSIGAKEGAIIAITAGGAALAIPIVIFGIAAGQGVRILVDQRLQRSIEEQQNLLARELNSAFETAFEQYCSRISDNLRLLYDRLIDYTKKVQSNWYEEKVSIFQVNDRGADETDWQKVITDASDFKNEILEALSSN